MRMPIPEDWNGTDWCCYVIEWPASLQWQAVLLGFITSPSRGPFWDEQTGNLQDVLEIGREIDSRNSGTEECPMGCLEDLAGAINNVANSLTIAITNAGGCGCSGSSGAGLFEAEPETFEDNGTDFPSGYTDRAEYETTKCDLARYILDRWRDDLNRLRQIQVSGTAASVLTALITVVLLTPVPFDDIILLVAGPILSLAAIGINAFVDACTELRDWIEAVDICLLYDAATVEEAKQNILDDLDAQVFANDALAKALFSFLVNFDALNVLFGPLPETINIDQLPTGDCSGCAAECEATKSIEIGTGPSNPAVAGTYTSAFVAGPNCHYIHVTGYGENNLRFVSITGWGSCNPPDQFRIASSGDGSSGDLYSDDTFPTGQCFEASPGDSLAFIFSGTGPFSIEIECC